MKLKEKELRENFVFAWVVLKKKQKHKQKAERNGKGNPGLENAIRGSNKNMKKDWSWNEGGFEKTQFPN